MTLIQPSRATFAILLVAAVSGACSRTPSADSVPAVRLDASNPQQTIIEIAGVGPADLVALSKASLSDDEWSAMFRVTVRGAAARDSAEVPAIAGRYTVADSIRFVPLFPLDPGREYNVSFDTSKVPRATAVPRISARAIVALPRIAQTPSTIVTEVYPSGDVIPENQLRMYVQFSGPMGQDGGLNHLVLLNKSGEAIEGAMLPLETELWNGDRTRYTVLLDPGRVKREILPNRKMGRALRRGDVVTLVVKSDWPDGRGIPLKAEYRKHYRVGPAIERPLDPAEWRIAAPPRDTRDALHVVFPAALDRALLERGLSVTRAGAVVPGQWRIEPGETRALFVPRDPWKPGDHALVVLAILEDVAGNRIGRAFEVRSPGEAVPAESNQPVSLRFRVGEPARTDQ